MSCSGKRCFIVTPIGDDGSIIRREIEGVFEASVKPVLLKLGFLEENVILPHHMDSGVMITKIINELLLCDLVIANLTGNNPNVMYEVGLRHAYEKPMIFICNTDTVLPFDLKGITVRFYQDDMAGSLYLRETLEKDIPSVLANNLFHNPVTIVKTMRGLIL